MSDSPKHNKRREDGIGYTIIKWVAGVASALVVGAISWNFATILDLMHRADSFEYALKYHGLWIK